MGYDRTLQISFLGVRRLIREFDQCMHAFLL